MREVDVPVIWQSLNRPIIIVKDWMKGEFYRPVGTGCLSCPIMPYLLKGGIEVAKGAAEELGKSLSAETWEGLEKLAEKIRQNAKAKSALQKALTEAQNSPEDKAAIKALALQLKNLLQEDAELLAEAAHLMTVIEANVRVGDVLPGGEVTGVRIKKPCGSAKIQSEVKTHNVSAKVTVLEYEG